MIRNFFLYFDKQSLIIFSLFSLIVTSFLLYTPILLSLSLASLAIFIFFYSKFFSIYKNIETRLLIYVLVFSLLLTAPFGFLKTNASIYHFAVGLMSILGAYVISSNVKNLSKSLKILVIGLQAVVLMHIYRAGQAPDSLESFIEGASSNGITSVLIMLQASYIGAILVEKRHPPIFTSISLLYISIVGYGRGSIIAAMGLLLLCVFLFSIYNRSKFWLIFITPLIIILVIVFGILQYDIFFDYLNSYTKISAGIIDYHRELINSYYISKIDLFNFFYGVPINGTLIETTYNGNLHSSFLRAHHLFGAIYIISIIFVIFKSVAMRRGFLEKFIFFILTSVVLFRAFSEPIIFPTALDILFYTMLFYGLNSSPLSKLPRME